MAAVCASAPVRVSGQAAIRQRQAHRLVVRAQAGKQSAQDAVMPAALLGAAATLLYSGSAQAAVEMANIAAAGDGRGTILAGLALPAVGWVLFNIAGPAKNQIDGMGEGTAVANSGNKKRGVAAGLGLGAASLLATQSAEAAQQVADLAAGDNRLAIFAGLALPAIGWVLFNILGPARNQIDGMGEGTAVDSSQNKKKRSVAAGLGLGAASLLATQSAEAAQQVADLAAGDNRLAIFAGLALPAIGWVLFNILGPARNQIDGMGEGTAVDNGQNKKKRSVAVGLGLGGASMLAVQSAEAAQQVADLAAGDNRAAIFAGLAIPAIGWVLFNIFGPAKNQIDGMGEGTAVAGSKAAGNKRK